MYQTIQNQTKPNLPIPNQAKLPAGPLSNVTCYILFLRGLLKIERIRQLLKIAYFQIFF